MGFTTPFFLFIMFPLTTAVFYGVVWLEGRLPAVKRVRLPDLVILGFSLIFFGWGVLSDVLYFACYILAVYALGLLLSRTDRSAAKKILAVAVILLLGVLYIYKYLDFSLSLFKAMTGNSGMSTPRLIPPLGISFLTFSAISYVVDIYRGEAEAGSLLDAALYLSFFPKIASGPLILWRDFSGQIAHRKYSTEQFVSGLNRIMIGFAKKLILADTFGQVCSEIQSAADIGIDVPTAWGCALLYALQIYLDFSGYSDIAIGLSRLFGFSVAENFHFPYVSTSITAFWRRWHISLGRWFKEYLYIPLGGSRRGTGRTLLNLAIVFFLTGLWHGAGWGYIAWGMLHGVFRLAEKLLDGTVFYQRIPRLVKWAITMLVVMIGWEFFRLGSFQSTVDFLAIMLGGVRFTWIKYSFWYFFTPRIWVLLGIALLGTTAFAHPSIREFPAKLTKTGIGFVAQELCLMLLMALAVMFMVNSTYSPFIYFRY